MISKLKLFKLFVSLILIVSNTGYSQVTVTPVDGSAQMDYLFNLYYNYSYSQTIYTQSQISQGGDITSIQFEYDGYSSGGTRNITVYMGHVSKSAFSSNSDWVSTGSMTQVFSGNYTFNTSSGWYEIDLDTDFTYNNSDNLVIAVDDNTGSYMGSSYEFYHKDSWSDDRCLYYSSDYTNANPASPPSGSRTDYAASLKLTMSTGPSITSSGSLSAFSACAGSNSGEQSFTIAGSSLEADILVSAPTGYEISTTSGSGFGSSLTLAQSAGTVNSTTTYVRLKDDASNSASGNIALTSTNATTVNVATGSATVNASTSYYVDDAGSNSNSGTSSGSPWLTLAYAISQAGQCATINIAAGTYTDDLLDVTSTHSGLTIAGAGIGSTIFQQSGTGDHFMEIYSGALDITVKNMTVENYDENTHGGAFDTKGVTSRSGCSNIYCS